jgi:hypothetical protein
LPLQVTIRGEGAPSFLKTLLRPLGYLQPVFALVFILLSWPQGQLLRKLGFILARVSRSDDILLWRWGCHRAAPAALVSHGLWPSVVRPALAPGRRERSDRRVGVIAARGSFFDVVHNVAVLTIGFL